MAGEQRLSGDTGESGSKGADRRGQGPTSGDTHEHNGSAANGRFIGVAAVLIPALVGVRLATSSREPDGDFYPTAAQVIATLFLALTVEFFARQAAGRGAQDAVIVLALSGLSWIGFFACMRALTGADTDLTRGLTGMGVTAASVLLAVALYDTMAARENVSHREKSIAGVMILIVLFAAILLLIY
jgi:hypothetical protein